MLVDLGRNDVGRVRCSRWLPAAGGLGMDVQTCWMQQPVHMHAATML